jgi:predicted deacylase
MRDGKPAFTCDLSGPWGTITGGGVDLGVRGILNVMKRLRMIKGEIEPHPGVPVLDVLKGSISVRAIKGGIVLALFRGGEFVPKNTPVAKIYNLYGDIVEVVKSPTDGYIFGYPLLENEAVATGEVVVSILRK